MNKPTKLISTLFIYVLTTTACTAEYLKEYRHLYGVQVQAINLDVAEADKSDTLYFDDTALALGVFYKNKLNSYSQLSVGIDYVYIDDLAPFSQTVENTITGQESDRSSELSGMSVYSELGLHYAFKRNTALVWGLALGYRYNDLKRRIVNCKTCDSQDSDFIENDFYVKPSVEYRFNEYVAVQLSYSQFIGDKGFSNGIALQVIVAE